MEKNLACGVLFSIDFFAWRDYNVKKDESKVGRIENEE